MISQTYSCKSNMEFTAIMMMISILGISAIDGYESKVVQFIFGDSLSDVGNNLHLNRSIAQANLPWYGIDFGNGTPNGRFTNGRTVSDIIGDKIGLPRPLAFLDPSLTEEVILKNGVNYASGGGGILNQTGSYFIERFCFSKQIELFQRTRNLITKKIGKIAADKFFHESQYVVALGSNDFINDYLSPVNADSYNYNDATFIDYLIQTFRAQLTLLHELGVRQLMAFGLGPVGCIPLQRVLSSTGGCQQRTNNLALSFNNATRKLMEDLSKDLANASFKFGDAYDVVDNVIKNPYKYGFNNTDSPCCSFGRIRPALTCLPASQLCSDRSKYLFWDEYHPSDRGNQIIADEIMKKLGFLTMPPSHAPAIAPAFQPVADSPSPTMS